MANEPIIFTYDEKARHLIHPYSMDLPDGNRHLSVCGVVYRPDKEKGIECYVDANFAGGWAQVDVDNAENVMARTV